MQRDRAVEPALQQQVDDDAQGGAPLHILVAEDNPVNQEVALSILESLGCDVTVVDNGADALKGYQMAVPGRFDVILMDCQMPVMDGFDAARRIRAWESGKRHIPILTLTGNTIDGAGTPALMPAWTTC